MADNQDDYRQLLEQKRFMSEVEQGIRLANQAIIHKRISEVTKESVLEFAVTVARLRAKYLDAAFRIGTGERNKAPGRKEVDELATRRKMYEEGRLAFEALRDAIERGYVTVQGTAGGEGREEG